MARRWFLRLFLFLLQLFPLMSELMRAMSPGFAGRTGLTVGAEASVEAAADQRCQYVTEDPEGCNVFFLKGLSVVLGQLSEFLECSCTTMFSLLI